MEIKVSSTSFANELARYAANRLITMRVAALVVLVIAVSLAISNHRSPASIGMTALLAGLLIVQFRLWDDLADLDFDRVHHPDRILVASHHVQPYFILVASLAVLNAVIIALLRSPAQLSAYVLLLAGTAILYRRRAWPGAWRLARTQLVLIKYPVFLYLCAQEGAAGNVAGGGIATYLLLSLIDLASDSSLRMLPARRWLLVFEIAAFAIIVVTFTWSMQN
jgi:hypothetical protein